MSDKTQAAITSLKAANIEQVQWENRMEGIKETYANTMRQHEALQSEINRKRADFDNYVGAKDSDVKKSREQLTADQQALTAQREEFKKILQQHEIDKSNHLQAVKELQIEKNKIDESRARVDGFVIALQRAYSLIS